MSKKTATILAAMGPAPAQISSVLIAGAQGLALASSPLLGDLVPVFLEAKSKTCRKNSVLGMLFGLRKLTACHAHQPIGQLTSLQIHQVISNPCWAANTQMSVLRTIKMIFRWARAQGYLPADQATAADLVHLPIHLSPPRFVPPHQLRLLLRSVRDVEILLKTVLHAFGALEDIELRRLKWEDIQRKWGIVVSGRVSGRARLAPIPRVLDAWLRPFYGSSGAVLRGSKSIERFHRWARALKIRELAEVLRNSYYIFRLAQPGNLSRTSSETGVSIATLQKRFAPVAAGRGLQAEEYFSLTPAKVGLRNWPRMVKQYRAQNPPRRRVKTP